MPAPVVAAKAAKAAKVARQAAQAVRTAKAAKKKKRRRGVNPILAAVVAGIVVAFALPIIVFGVSVIAVVAAVEATTRPTDPVPSAFALEDIPPELLDHYRSAARTCEGLPWTVVAGIGKVETDHGRVFGSSLAPLTGDVHTPLIFGPWLDGSLPGTRVITISERSPWHSNAMGNIDRALGPMQFLTDTFRAFGVDGNGDGRADPHNAFDAISSAVAYLCPDGVVVGEEGTDGVTEAILRYNHSDDYVAKVLDFAGQYGVTPQFAGSDPVALIEHPNFTVYPAGEQDLRAGLVDPQIVAILSSIVADGHTIHVTSLVTGHSPCIARTGTYPNCRISRHYSGRAADIWMFDGEVVANGNSAAREWMAQWAVMDREEDYARPWTIGHPWGGEFSCPGCFNDGDHEDHFHLGVTGTFADNDDS